MVTGVIGTRECALQIGHGLNYSNLIGFVDDVSIFVCMCVCMCGYIHVCMCIVRAHEFALYRYLFTSVLNKN